MPRIAGIDIPEKKKIRFSLRTLSHTYRTLRHAINVALVVSQGRPHVQVIESNKLSMLFSVAILAHLGSSGPLQPHDLGEKG